MRGYATLVTKTSRRRKGLCDSGTLDNLKISEPIDMNIIRASFFFSLSITGFYWLESWYFSSDKVDFLHALFASAFFFLNLLVCYFMAKQCRRHSDKTVNFIALRMFQAGILISAADVLMPIAKWF